MAFRVGDRVVCVRAVPGYPNHGVEGNTYTVTTVSRAGYITLEGLRGTKLPDRFQLAPPAFVDAPAEVLAAEPAAVDNREQVFYYTAILRNNDDDTMDVLSDMDIVSLEDDIQDWTRYGDFTVIKRSKITVRI